MSQTYFVEYYDAVIVLHAEAKEFEHHDERFFDAQNGAWVATDTSGVVHIQQGSIFVEPRCGVDWKDPLDKCVRGFHDFKVHLIVHVFNRHTHVGIDVYLPTPLVKVSRAHLRKKNCFPKKMSSSQYSPTSPSYSPSLDNASEWLERMQSSPPICNSKVHVL
jgi:hypothetical protein